MAQVYHPDKYHDPSAQHIFEDIQGAYDVSELFFVVVSRIAFRY